MAWISTEQGALNTKGASIRVDATYAFAEVQVCHGERRYTIYRAPFSRAKRFQKWLMQKVMYEAGPTDTIFLSDFKKEVPTCTDHL